MKQNRIIFGLGTNVGDRIQNLASGVELLKERLLDDVIVSCLYESEALLLPNSPAEWNLPYLNIAISGISKSDISALEVLMQVKAIEADVGRIQRGTWAPREIDIDILCWGQAVAISEMLTLPHRSLHERPFALWPLADIDPLWIFPSGHELAGQSAKKISERFGNRFYNQPWRKILCGTKRADEGLSKKFAAAIEPLRCRMRDGTTLSSDFVGVLNITPDSFSDGGSYLERDAAIKQIEHLYANGAYAIDIGAESTRPGAKALSDQEEWARLEPILLLLKQEFFNRKKRPLFSIDTYHPETAEKALAFGIDWINDVSAGTNKAMLEIIRNSTCRYALMHSLTVPVDKAVHLPLDTDPVKTICQWAENQLERLVSAGIKPERIILDPGIGFGKTAEQSLELLTRINELTSLHDAILVGHSRKSFIMRLFNADPMPERDAITATMSVKLAEQGVRYLRVHDIAGCKKSLQAAVVFNAVR